jgi:hypothetical protein
MTQGITLLGVLVSEGDFPSTREIEAIIERMDSKDNNDVTLDDELTMLRDSLAVVNPNYDFWTVTLLEAIDEIAEANFKDVQDIIGIAEPGYGDALSDYTKDVIAAIEKEHGNHQLVPKVVARFKFAMNDTGMLPIALPLTTDFILESMALSFKTIQYALNAVSYSELHIYKCILGCAILSTERS